MNQSAPSSSEFPALSLVDVEGDFSMNRSFTYGKYFVSCLLYGLQIQEYTKYVISNIKYEIFSKYTQITIIIKIRGETILLRVGNTHEKNA